LRGRTRGRCDGRRDEVDHVDRGHLIRAIKKVSAGFDPHLGYILARTKRQSGGFGPRLTGFTGRRAGFGIGVSFATLHTVRTCDEQDTEKQHQENSTDHPKGDLRVFQCVSYGVCGHHLCIYFPCRKVVYLLCVRV
jgi:hypothetical protein